MPSCRVVMKKAKGQLVITVRKAHGPPPRNLRVVKQLVAPHGGTGLRYEWVYQWLDGALYVGMPSPEVARDVDAALRLFLTQEMMRE